MRKPENKTVAAPSPRITRQATPAARPAAPLEPAVPPVPSAPSESAAPSAPATPAILATPVTPAEPRAAPPAGPPAGAAAAVPARFDASYLNNPKPDYPRLSRRLREQGTVMLRVLVTTDGKADKIEVFSGSGFPRLDAAAERAVSDWRFVPARNGGRNVEAWVVVPIVFKLEGL